MVLFGYPVSMTAGAGGVYRLQRVEVDHAASSPVVLGIAPANSLVSLVVVCTEAPVGSPVCTLGDADDADSHFVNVLLPVVVNDVVVGQEIFYSASKNLLATITSACTAGKWQVTPVITEIGTM